MDPFSPELATYWVSSRDPGDAEGADGDDRRVAGDDQALAELADRILAARSVV